MGGINPSTMSLSKVTTFTYQLKGLNKYLISLETTQKTLICLGGTIPHTTRVSLSYRVMLEMSTILSVALYVPFVFNTSNA